MQTRASTGQLRRRRLARAACVRLTLLAAWMLGIFMFSAQPGQSSAGASDSLVTFFQELGLSIPADALSFLIRKGAHAFAYFGLGVLSFRALQLSTLSLRTVATVSLAFVLAYAASDEIHQLFVPGRSGEVRDILIDTTASAGGILVMYFMHRRTHRYRAE